MKKISTLLVAVAFTACTNQLFSSGGPDAYGYTYIESTDVGGPLFNWIDITSRPGVQTVAGLADDNSAAGMINIGFNFHYYWNDYSQLKVGSNGWVSFNNISNIAACFPTIPTAGGVADNYLAPLMADLNFTGAGNPGSVQYWTNSVDSFIISYINVPFWSVSAPGWTGSNTFQVILCNTDSSITFQYGALSGFNNNAACVDLTLGIENSTGSIGLQEISDALPPANYVIRFDYPAVVLLSIQDALPQWNNNTANAAEFILMNNALNVTTDIRNAGNTAITAAINLQTTIQDLTPTTVYTGTGSIPALAAGADSVFTYPTTWTPTAAGQYSFNTTVTCSQDINAANNSLTTELDAVDVCGTSMLLSYNTTGASTGSINWNGGANDDGVAVYFEPPVYPYTISSLEYYIASNTSDGFIAQVYDDDGPGGSAGTQLFTTTVASGSITPAAWNTVTVSAPVTLASGGYYVVWLQTGSTIFVGTETAGPRSHHNFEILDGAWSAFRYDDAQDLMIRSTINGYTNAPTAGMSVTTNNLTLSGTDMSTGLVTSWLWDFGDATTSTQQNPTHVYAMGGSYTVCLTAISPCTTSVTCTTITVCQAPAAAYSASATGTTVGFTDMSTGTINMYQWDFGDANTSTLPNPTHNYAGPGTYTVCLIVGNLCGQADTFCQSVTVCYVNNASFTYSTNEDSLFVMDASSGTGLTWVWDFGDGNFSTAQNPGTHVYATGGIYTICLTTTDTCGVSDTMCVQDTIIITEVSMNVAGIISMYPNPANEVLMISLANNQNSTIEIFDLTGQLIIAENQSTSLIEINVSGLAEGLYTVRITNEAGSIIKRFIKR